MIISNSLNILNTLILSVKSDRVGILISFPLNTLIYLNTFGAETFSWQDPVRSWKAGPGQVMTMENYYYYIIINTLVNLNTLLYVLKFIPLYT